LDDAPVNAQKLVAKIEDDYALASLHLGSIMKEWHFVHNLVDGLPVTAVQKLDDMRNKHTQHKLGFIGPTALEGYVFELGPDDLLALLGPAANAEDSRNLRMEEVRDLIQDLMIRIDVAPVLTAEISPVPNDKLEFNKLPAYWSSLIMVGMQNAAYVKEYFDRHHDVEVGDKLAKIFSQRYQALKLEHLSPGAIMDTLYELITGVGSVTAHRQVAAQALLAHLFESCDIFEGVPSS
jgi:hypothetical protein